MTSMYIYKSSLFSSCIHSWAHYTRHCTIDVCLNCESYKFSDTPWFKGVKCKNRNCSDTMCPLQKDPPEFGDYVEITGAFGRF